MSLLRLSRSRVRFDGDVVVSLPDLALERGERVAVVGPNGSGKSTLLRVLAGLLPAEGTFETTVEPRDVAWLAQRPYLVRGSVAANVELALLGRDLSRPERRRRALASLERLGVVDLAERPRRALSEGQLQRVALARAIAAAPAALLLDEPLGPLDAEGAGRVVEILRAEPTLTVVVAAPTEAALPAIEYSQRVALR